MGDLEALRSEVIGAVKLSFDEIAYSNCLPWRTHSKSKFTDTVARKVATLYVRPLIEELRPWLIVARGKERVPAILQMTGLSLPPVIPWNRSQAATPAAKHERDNAATEILKFVNERRGAAGGGSPESGPSD